MTRSNANRAPDTDHVTIAPPARDLAPVDAGEPEDIAPTLALAPVFPTEADIDEITADLIAADPELSTATERALSRAVQAEVAKRADRIARRRHSTAAVRRADLAIALAPTFPTEAHVAQLVAAVPALTADELRNVLAAGHDAYTASIAAGEPITEAPEKESAQ